MKKIRLTAINIMYLQTYNASVFRITCICPNVHDFGCIYCILVIKRNNFCKPYSFVISDSVHSSMLHTKLSFGGVPLAVKQIQQLH